MDDKVKFLCSFGGKLSPRPGDGRLRYSGGETRIVGFQRNVRYSEFVSKLREVCDLREEKIVTKYQPVQCDLDHLVSVVSDEDVKYMMDEANCTDGSRIRLFLFPYVGDSTKRQQQFDYNQKKCDDRSGYSDEYSKKTSDKQHNQQAQLIQKNVYTGMPMSQPPDQGILSWNEGSRGHPAQQYAMEKRQVVVQPQPQPQPQPQAHNVGPDWHAQSIMGDFHGVGQGNYQPRSSNYMHYQEDASLYANRPYIEHSPHMYNDASHKQVVFNSSGEAYVMPGSNHSSMEYQIHDDPQARKSGGQNENYNWIDYQQRGDPQPHSGNLRHHYVLPDQEYRLVGGGQGQLLSPSRQNPEINRGVVVPSQYEPREIKHTQSKKSVMENKRPIIEPPEVLPISYPIQSPQRRADYLAYEQSDRLSDRFPSGQSEDSNVTISSARYQPTERYPSGQSEDNSVAFYPSRYPEAGMPRGQAYPERPELSQKGQYAGKGNSSTEEPSIANNNQRDIHRPFSLITDRSPSEPSSTEKYDISSYNERTLQERSSTEKRAIVNSKPGGYEYTSEAPIDEQYVINMERPYIDFRGSSDSGFASEEKSQSNGISNKQIYHTDMMQEQLPKDSVVEKASKAKKENIQIKSSSNTESESDSQLKSLERGRKETGVMVPQTEKLLEIRGVSYDELPAKRHNESGITAPPKVLSDRDYTESIGNSSVASSHQMPLVYQEQSIHNSLELRDHVFRHNSANYDKDSYALTTAAISNPLSRHQAEHLQHSHESLIANKKNSSFDAPNQRLSYDSIPPQSTRVSQSSSSNQEARSSKGNHHFLQGSTSIADDLSIPSHFPPLLQQGIIPVRPAKSFEDGDHLLEQTHQRAYQDQSLLYEGISKSGGSSSYKQYEGRGYLSPQDSTFATDATLDTFYKGGSISGDHKKHFSSDGNQKLSPQSEAEKLGRIPTNSDDSKRVEKFENVRNVNIGYQKDLGSQFITKQPNYNGDRVKKTQIDGTGNLNDLDLSFDTSSRELVPVIQVETSTGVAGTIDALDHVQSGACFSLNIRAPDRNVKAYKESSEPKMPPLSGKNPVVATTNSPMYGHALGNGKKGNDAMETDPAQMSTFEMSYLESKVNNLKLSQQENRFGGNNVADVGSAFSSSSSDSSIHDPGKMFSLAISSFAPKKDNTVIQYAKKEVKEGGHVRYNDEVSLPSEQAHLQESLANEIDMEEQAKKLSLEMARTMAMEAEAEALAKGLQIVRNNDLEEIRELGSGTYGTVYHGKWRGSDVAIKRIKASCFEGSPTERGRLIADFWKEATILGQLHHPNVVSFYGVVRDGPNDSLATVTEFMVNGSLKTVLRKKDRNLDRRKRLILAMDAAFGMEYLHEKNIVHFDLKCENLLVNMRDPQRPLCKIGDMGLSKVKHQTLVTGGVRGTLPWMAPELLSGDSGMVSDKVDVYSFGIVMWELLTGEEPYANLHCGSIIGGIMKNTLRPTIPSWCETAWKSLMERCWANDPRKRPSFSEISVELRAVAAGNKWC